MDIWSPKFRKIINIVWIGVTLLVVLGMVGLLLAPLF